MTSFADMMRAILRGKKSDAEIQAFLVGFFAVLAACLKALFVGAPFAPGFLIVSPEPFAIRFRLARMLA